MSAITNSALALAIGILIGDGTGDGLVNSADFANQMQVRLNDGPK